MNKDTHNAALLAALVALRDESSKRLDDARSKVLAAHNLPKGTKGKRDAIANAEAGVTASAGLLNEIRAKIREAMKAKVKAIVEASLATLDHRDADPVLRQAMEARRKRHVAVYYDEPTAYGVHLRMSLDRFGLPDYIELSMLATPAEHREQVERWIAKATTPEAKAEAQAVLDNPEAHPLSCFGSSVTVSRGHGEHRNTYGVNGSTFHTFDDDHAARLRTLHGVAWHLRSCLNDADLPKVEDLEEILDGNG